MSPSPIKAPSALYEEAVRLNNEGVLALSHGDSERAKQKLTNALKCCLVRERQLEQDTAFFDEQHRQQEVGKLSTALDILQSSELFPIPGLRNLPVKNKNSFLASSAVFLALPPSLFTLDDPRIVDGAAAVIFNLALVHHLQSIQLQQQRNDGQCETSLDAAEKCYTMMLELLCEPRHGISSSFGVQLDTGTVLRIAAINNLAQIQMDKRCGECHQEEEVLAQLRSFLQSVEQEQHESSKDSGMVSGHQPSPENLQRIIHTMLFYLFTPPYAVAPAA